MGSCRSVGPGLCAVPPLSNPILAATHAPTPDEQAFEAIKAAIDLCPPDQKLMLNSSQFYGRGPREANLHLVSRFFAKYPELTDRVFLSVKVC